MIISKRINRAVIALLLIFTLAAAAAAQKTAVSSTDKGRPVFWENVNVGQQDLFLGPGGKAMKPDLSRITFVKEDVGGHSKKYRITDGSGNLWVAKIGDEAQSETAAVRLLYALGYKTEINYLVPTLTIPGKGVFRNVRLEARPADVERGKQWNWGSSPFEGTPQMRGLMLMMAFINNWDMKSANNVILKKGAERQYVISDLGVSFGKTGSNSLPLFWRIGRSRNKPGDYSRSDFVRDVHKDRIEILYNGKNRSRMRDFTVSDARWLADRLTRLSDKQIRDAFRAANYSQSDIEVLTATVKRRIGQLDEAGSMQRLAGRR